MVVCVPAFTTSMVFGWYVNRVKNCVSSAIDERGLVEDAPQVLQVGLDPAEVSVIHRLAHFAIASPRDSPCTMILPQRVVKAADLHARVTHVSTRAEFGN